jgi:hypothetical protein
MAISVGGALGAASRTQATTHLVSDAFRNLVTEISLSALGAIEQRSHTWWLQTIVACPLTTIEALKLGERQGITATKA